MGNTPDAPKSMLWDLSQQCDRDSRLWFPNTADSLSFMGLALAGEVGELCNIIKKVERGTDDWHDPAVRRKAAFEATDAFIYTMNISALLKFDMMGTYNIKRRENQMRFGNNVGKGN